MTRRLKKPDGELYEEFVTASSHCFDNGELVDHVNDTDGSYTGRFWFQYPDGKTTRMYTESTAPQWLLAYYEEATTDAT